MNSKKKSSQTTSGTRKKYKSGQLYTYRNHIYQFAHGTCGSCKITKDIWVMSMFCHICPSGCCVKIIK